MYMGNMAKKRSYEELLQIARENRVMKKLKMISLNVPIEMLAQIDQKTKDQAGFNRTTWILQALQKELEK